MSAVLIAHQVGPSLTIQDLGRQGYMANGLSPGGAADKIALAEGAALLRQPLECAALEMPGFGGTFETTTDTWMALTGAPMVAQLDGEPLIWNSCFAASAGQTLNVGGAKSGTYGYLHVLGGLNCDEVLGSQSAHLAGGIGEILTAGTHLPISVAEPANMVAQSLPLDNRYSGGTIRVLPSVQTNLFAGAVLDRFQSTEFKRSPRGNRQGVALEFDGAPFATDVQLTILSESMVTGDIQMTGEGEPYVLLPECQTTGGYPRIGTVVPDDLPIVAQATPGTALQFQFVTHDQALANHVPLSIRYAKFRRNTQPLVRNPHDIPDLLGYQLISGAITGRELD